MRLSAIERFYKHTKRDEITGCLNWTASLNTGGYGHLGVKGKLVRANRFIYFYTYPEISTDFCILHKCDNPKCVEITHLFHGTHSANMEDMLQKGRQVPSFLSKEQHGMHKLTELNVEKIRKLYKPYSKQFNQHALAKMFSVSQAEISNIIKYKTWKN